uniref:Polycalin n=1 Tax=Helicoverpa armigera TaxID=29058 RepID=B6CMG1_HELAM|nr:polycalin [Helicoverpa armigera]
MAKLIVLVFNLFCIFSASVAVIQTGQCDQNIAVVTSFNLDAFGGAPWYDIESYANTHQSGTCNTARYTINADRSITVQNSQVVNQALAVANGEATIATESIGKLQVRIGGSTVPIDYWVLSTDYTGYALIYSCRNVNANTREVFSWKLSRTQSGFTPAATQIMTGIINSIDALNQNDYITRDHSANGCFYYPANDPSATVIDLPGSCETITGLPSFNTEAYLGTWYEIARYPQPTQQGQCNRATYGDAGNGIVSVLNEQVLTESLASISGTATSDNTGKITVTFNIGGQPQSQDLYVLATDYLNYALVYACTNLDNGWRRVGSWKLSRRKELSANALQIMDLAIANTQGLHQQYYRDTQQTEAACFYYPVFDGTETTIDLPGSCASAAIVGMPSFNINSYTGVWYEIERYPQPTQQGQCNRAIYTANEGGVVSVMNSQVVNEVNATISGVARVISTDNSGVLQVTFTIGGQPTNQDLYVLSTDYTSYSIVYACTDLNNGWRRVGSWKLSRRQTGLSASDISAINNVITTTQGLNQDYYRSTSQTNQACFYYPVFPTLPDTIDLPGPCETTTVSPMPSFNINRYQGLWYEVARYPQPTQQGQCNRATYGANTVTNRQVLNQGLLSIDGTIALPDSSGRLQVTFNIGGTPQTTELLVLSTDYESYSIVYTCQNIEGGMRRVGSWKLSRTPTLTAQAISNINNVIAATQGLKEEYYQSTSQSNEACFYYPTGPTENEIRLPFTCDTSLSGIPSFNLTAFARTWYHIQRYDPVQGITCSGTRFTVNSGNTLNVVDFEVVGEELVTVEGTARINSTDGSGQLLLTTTDGDETSEIVLYILATDYTGYAVALSCENVDDDWRRVRAWQLSSGRTLPAAAVPVITTLINNQLELHSPFFNAVTQNEDCQEPSSAMLFKSSIIVIFVCTVLHALW